MEDHVRLFFDMVQIDSESGEETQFIAYLKGLFESLLKADCTLDAYGNLIARVPGKRSKKTEPILLCAHSDTVKPGKGIEPVILDGVIRSAGDTILGADGKAGIVEIFTSVQTADNHPPVEILITRDEESGLLGAKSLDPSMLSARIGFVVDSDVLDTVIIGGPSEVDFDIEIIGKAAHAGMEPEKGTSAIRVAAKAIAAIPEGRLDAETTANVGVIRGGIIRNGVPERATIQAECRSLNHEKCMLQAEIMRYAFEEAAAAMGAQVKIASNLCSEASKLSQDAQTVLIAKKAIAAAGLEPKTKIITGGTDAQVLNEKGVEAVVLGMGVEAEHTTDEQIAIADLDKGTEILRQVLHILA